MARGQAGGGLGRFLLGILVGIVLALGYVRFGVSLPGVLLLPERLRDNLVSTAAETQLYDLAQPADVRARALEVLVQTRPREAVALDAELGHPLLDGLYRRRAAREARQLLAAADAYGTVLAQDGLRAALVRRHGTDDPEALAQAMLAEAAAKSAFLAAWLRRSGVPTSGPGLRARLVEIARGPR
jgi:hypothetical protein